MQRLTFNHIKPGLYHHSGLQGRVGKIEKSWLKIHEREQFWSCSNRMKICKLNCLNGYEPSSNIYLRCHCKAGICVFIRHYTGWKCLEMINAHKNESFRLRIHEPPHSADEKYGESMGARCQDWNIFSSEMDPTGQMDFFIRSDFVSDIEFSCLASQNQKTITRVDSLLRIDFKKPNKFMPIDGYKPRTSNNCQYLINEWPENGLWSCDMHMNNCIFQCGMKSVMVSCQCKNIGPFISLA